MINETDKMTKILVSIFLSAAYLTLIRSKCTNETHGIYCTNLTGDENNLLVFNHSQGSSPGDAQENANTSVKSVFLRNSTGDIKDTSFATLPAINSLDIQFSGINNFSIDSVPLDALYLIKNYKFPNLTEALLKRCCQNLTILFVTDNQGLFVENGAFKHTNTLQHLTITGQNITNLNKNFLEGLDELTYLNLGGNGVQNIEGSAFEDLDKLSHLGLNNNDIKNFNVNTFLNLKNLENLDLLGLDLEEFNPTIFSNQRELKYIGVPSKLVKEKLQLRQLTKTFRKLEAIGLVDEDNNDTVISDFIETCKYSGFEIKLRKTDYL